MRIYLMGFEYTPTHRTLQISDVFACMNNMDDIDDDIERRIATSPAFGTRICMSRESLNKDESRERGKKKRERETQ